MMTSKRLLTMLSALVLTLTAFAQTANNDLATIKWAMTSGTITEAPSYTPADVSQFIEKAEIIKGSGLKDPVAMTSTVDNITQTMFPVTSKSSSASDANAVQFLITLKKGIAFTPKKVSFKAFRWKTDKGNFNATWVCDGSKNTLATGERPNRGAGSNAGTVSEYSYDISGTSASEQQFGISFNIYNFDVAADKGASFGDIIIEGTLYGTVGQPLTYTLTATVSPEGAGTIQATPQAASYESGTAVTLSQTPNDGFIFTGWTTSTGKLVTTSNSYTFNIKGNTTLVANYVTEVSMRQNDYKVVSTTEELRAAIKELNETPSAMRRFIFLKNGTYDYGEYNNPESGATPYGRDTLKADNISMIGQSTEGVTICITPKMASVSRTAPIMIRSTGTYLQNITFQNNYSYGGNEGQAAALHDRGHHTIGKFLRLASNQDTYYSHTDYGQLYFEDSQFEGTVDYICGRGDVFFNRCHLLCVNRQPKQGDYKGDTHIAAPYTVAEDFNAVGGHGYIFNECTVDCKAKTWDFGRGWRAWPKAAFINTTLSEDAAKRLGNDQTSGKEADGYAVVRDIDYSLRVTTKGVKSSDDSESVCRAMDFFEYNTMDMNGNVVSPESNVLTFTAANSKTYETILKSDEIERFKLRNVFPDWAPDEECHQVVVTSVTRTGNSLSWTTDAKAKAFLIEQDGDFVTIVDGTENGIDLSSLTLQPSGKITVRAANMKGGFGSPTEEGTMDTGITGIPHTKDNGKVTVRKVIENGQLIIYKDGRKFNAIGQQFSNSK